LGDEYAPILENALKSGMTIREFFATNPELGDMSEYNLDQFKEN